MNMHKNESPISPDLMELQILREIVTVQNKSITLLSTPNFKHDKLKNSFDTEINRLNDRNNNLKIKLDKVEKELIKAKNIHNDDLNTNDKKLKINPNNLLIPPLLPQESSCENRYGLNLLENWKQTEEIWCKSNHENTKSPSIQSTIKCFPYHQQHKKLDGRGPDMFCVAYNILIDFSKV